MWNPFGGKSLVENLKNLTQIFTGPAGGDVTSGGNATQDTNPGVPAQNYKVTMSINHLASPTVNSESGFTTNGGYKVYKFSKEELKIIEELVYKVRQDLLSRC